MGSIEESEGQTQLIKRLMRIRKEAKNRCVTTMTSAEKLLTVCHQWDPPKQYSETEKRGPDVGLGFFPKAHLLCDSYEESEDTTRFSIEDTKGDDGKMSEKQSARGTKREAAAEISDKKPDIVKLLDSIFSSNAPRAVDNDSVLHVLSRRHQSRSVML